MMFYYGALGIIGLALSIAFTVIDRTQRRDASKSIYRAHRRQMARTTIITSSRRDPLVVGEMPHVPPTARIRDLPKAGEMV